MSVKAVAGCDGPKRTRVVQGALEAQLIHLFQSTRTIAIVGLSPDSSKASFGVAQYLKQFFRIIPINPKHTSILDEVCYPDLKSVPIRVDMIDMFQRSDRIPSFLDDALDMQPLCFWMQLGIEHLDVATRLEAQRIRVIQDRCTKIDHQSLTRQGKL